MIASADKRSILDRMLGAALLEPDTYQEAMLSSSLRTQAIGAVAITVLAGAVGGVSGGVSGFILAAIIAALGWAVYAIAAYRLATDRYGVRRTAETWGSTWRMLALASGPRVFLALSFVPAIGLLLALAVHVWVMITSVFALRQAFDLELRPAMASAAAGVGPMFLLWVLALVLLIA